MLLEKILKCPAAGQQVEDQHDDRNDQQNVDPRAERGEADKADEPEDDQYNCDCPEHLFLPCRPAILSAMSVQPGRSAFMW